MKTRALCQKIKYLGQKTKGNVTERRLLNTASSAALPELEKERGQPQSKENHRKLSGTILKKVENSREKENIRGVVQIVGKYVPKGKAT